MGAGNQKSSLVATSLVVGRLVPVRRTQVGRAPLIDGSGFGVWSTSFSDRNFDHRLARGTCTVASQYGFACVGPSSTNLKRPCYRFRSRTHEASLRYVCENGPSRLIAG